MSLVRQVDATLAATIQDYLLQHPSDGTTMHESVAFYFGGSVAGSYLMTGFITL